MSRRCARCSADVATEANYCARCGALVAAASTPDAHDPLLGRVLLGRYRVVRRLGEGGMGKVYLAEQAMGQATRPVALKTLRKELMGDAKISGRFLRESEIVIRLAHPNTIQFYDFGQLDDGTLVIVMEYIEGRTLAEELRRGPLPLARVEALITQICGSLAEAHGHGIVHRDLKPHNVLLTSRAGRDDFVKLVDFGIALRSGEGGEEVTRLTTQGTLIGTPPYMSPEQFQDQAVDARSDVYSLGVMLFEMLTGELPFDAKSAWQWATAHIEQAPKALADHPRARELPPERAQAVMRALEKDRTRRPADAGELLRDFLGLSGPAEVGASQPDPAAPAVAQSTPEVSVAPTLRAPLPERRSAAAWLAWLPVVILVAVGAALSWRGRGDTPALAPGSEQDSAVERGARSKRTPVRKAARPGRAGKVSAAMVDAGPGAEAQALTAPGPAAADRAGAVEELASLRRALAAGQLDEALIALHAAQRARGPDDAELAQLRAQLADLATREVSSGGDASCVRMRSLERRLAQDRVPISPQISTLLRACAESMNSPMDAGDNSASAP